MSTARTLAKNATALLAAQVVSIIVTLIYFSYSARYLKPDGFSVLSFALSFTTMFAYFADCGFSTITTMKVARDRSLVGKYLGNMAILRILISMLLFFLMVIVVNVLGYPIETAEVIYIIAISTLLYMLNGLFNSTFQAFEKMEYQSIGTMIYSILMLSGTFFIIKNNFGLLGFAFLNLITNLIVITYSIIVCTAIIAKPVLEIDIAFLKANIIEALPFGIGGFFQTIFYSIDSLLLFNMQKQEVLGWYSASSRLVHYLQVIPLIINITVFPAMARFYFSYPDNLRLIYEKYFKFMLVIGVPMAVGTTILSDKIIWSIYGDGFNASIIAMQILIWSVLISFVYATFLQIFNTTNHQRLTTIIIGIGMVVNLAMNVILIPLFSYIGSSIALVIAELFILAISFIYVVRLGYSINSNIIIQMLYKITAASIIMGIFIWFFKSMNILMLVLLAMLLYFGLLYLLGGLDTEDIKLARSILKGI